MRFGTSHRPNDSRAPTRDAPTEIFCPPGVPVGGSLVSTQGYRTSTNAQHLDMRSQSPPPRRDWPRADPELSGQRQCSQPSPSAFCPLPAANRKANFEQSAIDFERSVINFDPSAINFERSAIDFDPSAVNFERSAISFERSATDFDLSAIDFERSATDFDPSATNFDPSAANFERSAIDFNPSALCSWRAEKGVWMSYPFDLQMQLMKLAECLPSQPSFKPKSAL